MLCEKLYFLIICSNIVFPEKYPNAQINFFACQQSFNQALCWNTVGILKFSQMINCFAHCCPKRNARVVPFIKDQLFFTSLQKNFHIKKSLFIVSVKKPHSNKTKNCIFKMSLGPNILRTYNRKCTIIFWSYRSLK